MGIFRNRGGAVTLSLVTAAIVLVVAVAVGLDHVGVEPSGNVVLVAAIVIAVAFGLRAALASCLSGIVLLAERPISAGDWIAFGPHEGTVRRITLRATELQGADQSVVFVPNSELMTRSFTVCRPPLPDCRVTFTVGIGYSAELGQARNVLLQTLRTSTELLQQPPPCVEFAGFGPNSVELTITAFAHDASAVARIKTDLAFALLADLRAARIEVPLPQHDVRLRDLEPIRQALAAAMEERRRGAGEPSADGQ